jgi:periplasmic copper chaperone A
MAATLRSRFRFIAALVACLLAAPASAHDYKLGSLEISHPWTRATPKGAAVAGGYVKITNTGTTPDRLVGGSLTGAGRFEVHDMRMAGGVMQMRPVTRGLEIKPGETVEFKPGAFHLMFLDLKQPLQQGQRVKGTLVFEKAGSIEVEYVIESLGGPPAAGQHTH